MNWQDQLISIYLTACDFLEQYEPYDLFRISPNSCPSFTDAEVLSIYIFGIFQGQRSLKGTHTYTKNHLKEWFPRLPSYEAFLARSNNLSDMWVALSEYILRTEITPNHTLSVENIIVVDSMPIVMASGFRSQKCKTAEDFASMGYCASKKLHYYGVKFHMMADYQEGTLPTPSILKITSAKVHDLTAIKEQFLELEGVKILGDKAYISKENEENLKARGSEIHTPVKLSKSKKTLDDNEKAYSKVVSSFRQSIEIFFGWINEVTGIQKASKVRSKRGLYVHLFGRFSAALFAHKFRFGMNIVNS